MTVRVPGLKALARVRWRLRGRILGGGAILGYHRVAEDPSDPWGNCVAPGAFREQMAVLRRRFRPVSLSSLLSSRSGGRSRGPAPVAVTFDDGYASVLEEALPVLEEHEIPATVFAVSGALGGSFWWDRLQWIAGDAGPGSEALELQVDGFRLRWPGDGGGETLPAYLHRSLRIMPAPVREEAVMALESWAGKNGAGARLPSPPGTLDEEGLRRLARSPLVEIGSHTTTHPVLPGLPSRALREELEGSRRALETIVDRPVRSLSYPFGEEDPSIRREAGRSGYDRACASWNGLITEGSDPFRLPRLWSPDAGGDVFGRWLTGWTGR
jgi:peptidoglycan/xylan/chitin deacetylase (PgdA/CDA1 family)